jgi:tetratricopeptide (TPR) repeat protein
MGVRKFMTSLKVQAILLILLVGGFNACQATRSGNKPQQVASQFCARGIAATDPREARRYFQQAAAADPLFGPAYNNLGVLDFNQGNYFEAAKNFDQAIKLMPANPAPRIHLGLIYEDAGQLRNALEQFDQALELAPDSMDAAQADTRVRVRLELVTPQVLDRLRAIAVRGTDATWRSWAQQALITYGYQAPASQPG